MQKLKIAKDWNKHKRGFVVTVDSLCAEYLRKNGFVEKENKES